ncbi:malectin domain-containing carbohydrate-binding protein, partial [Maribacter aquivivus]|uniref:malectin domain-containing carbohydrate-binding protein n=1 Tax=Maribacter aquivivus TaxID=228958 RepID=UPI0024919642
MKKILLFTTDLFSNLFSFLNSKKSFQYLCYKRLLIIVITFLGYNSGLIAQNVDVIFTDPTDTNIEIGESFSVIVQIQAGTTQVNGSELHISFDSNIIEVSSLETNPNYPVPLVPATFNNLSGVIDYGGGSFPPFQLGTIDFLTINFIAKNNGISNLNFIVPSGTALLVVTGLTGDLFANFIDSSIQVGTINQSPTADFTATPGIGAQSLEVAFNAGTSTDPDGNGTIVSYSWDFGDGSPVQLGQTPTYIYSSAGTYSIELTIEDDGGLTDVITKNITVTETVVNTIPSISAIANQSVNENDVLNLNNIIEILDADNDNLSVTISSISNEPQELQSNNNSPQTDPFPFNASGFLTENILINTPGSYSSDLMVSPTFGDGGSNGDGSAVYTITISVTDEDSNTVIETFDVTVNDIPQELSASNSVRIEAESYDNQGNLGGGVGVGVEVGAKTVVGFTGPGDFVEYTINVPTTGTYEFNFNSSNGSAQTGTLTINNEPSATVIVPQSTNWSVFGNYNTSILLNQGIQTIRFDWSGGNQYYSNTDYFDVTFIGSINTAPTVSILTPVDGLVVSRGTSFNISGDANDLEDGNISSNISWSSDSDTGFIATPNTGSAVTGVFLEPGSQTLKAFVSDSNSSPLTVTDEINVEVSCPQVAFQSPSEGSVITGTSVTIDVSTVDLLFGTVANPNEHFHFFINPPDVNNIDVSKRISTALNGNQTVFTFDDSSGALAYDGNGNGIIEGANTVVVVAARANHVEFDCVGAKAILNFIVTPAITDTEAPVITLNGSSVIDLNVNDVYVDAGATATDNVDSNVTVNTLGSVDTSIAGQYEITYSATDIAGNTGTAIRTVNVNTTTPFQICIASGSAGLTAFGRTFIGDPNNVAPTGQGFSRANGKKYSGYTGAIAGTNTPDELLLFQKEIYGGKDAANPSLEYNVPVTNGFYQVDLYIAEIYHPASGGRVFDVSLEGNIILDEYDPVNPIKDGISSNQTAITRTYFVNVVDGSIEIGVGPASTDNGKISGFCITEVASANLLPSSAIGNLTAEAGTPVSLGLNINDPENDNLTITINPALPIGLSLDVASKAISGTASIDAIGSYVFNAIISDGNSSPVTEQFQLEITAPANDTSPIIATINDIIVNEGDPISLSVTVTDDINPNANLEIFDISLGGTNTPFNPTTSVNGYTFTGTNGNYILDWTPNQGRSYLARVTANDGVNPSVIEEFTINVAQQVAGTIIANTFNNPIPWYGSSNPQGGLTVAIETAGNVGYIGAGEFLEYLINVETVGAYDITFTAANGSGADGTSTDITILEEGNGTALGTVTVPKKEWNIYDPFSTTVNFTNTGLKTLRLEFNGGVNIQQFVFAQLTATQPPIFTKEITDQSNLVGDSPQGLFIEANDPDGGDVTFSVTGSLPTGLTIDLTTGEISGTILPGAIDNSPYSVIITATDDESETAISSFTWTIEPLIVFPICVNVGNQPSVNAFGKTFASDQYLTSVATAYNKVVSNYSGVVQGSGEEALFQSENYNDPLNYAVPTGDGQFTVELYFAELYIGVAGGGTNLGAGERLFDINVEGSIETSVDLFSEFGPLTAATKTFSVTVTDGVLNIDLDAIADNAKLSGFCIVETSNFVTNAAPSLSIEVVEDVLDCENNGEDFILTASANDAEQGNLDSIIVWKDNVGTIVGTGGTLALTSVIGSATYTAEVQDATPAIVTQSITVNVIANTAPTLEDILAAPVTIEPGETISLSSVAADLEDDDTTLTISWNSDIETNNGGNLGTGSSITPILNVEGNHFITASVTDACGITTTKTTTVVVNTEDVTAPIITLKGANPQIIELGDGYSELGATTNDGSIVTIDASEFLDAVGSYNILYDANDGVNDAVQIVREVNVVDTSIPLITLNGDNPQIIELGTGYSELGATTNDGSIVTIDASAFVDAVGSYNILYDANDGVNDAVQIVRAVNVVDNVAPIITLNGANPQYISLGSGYTELGAITDDGSLVAIDASAFVDAVGTYNIIYTANDGVNDAAQIERVVNVYEDGVFLNINPVNTNVSIGDSFDVKVLLSTGIQPVNGAEIHLNFDPAILQVSSLTPTTIPFNIPVLTQNFDNTQGTIDYGAGTFTTPFPSGNFEMITVSFTAVGSGNSPINFINPENTAGTVVTANGNVLDGTNNGTVVVDVTPGIEITPNSISSTLFVGETTIVSFDLDSNNETNLPTSANIVITDNATSITSTWATTPAIGIQGVNELVFNTIGLVPGLYTATLTASGINGYDDVSIQVSLQVAELPNLIFSSNNFEFTLDSEEQLSESFELVTSNDSPLPQDLILTVIDAATSQPPTWLILNGANNGFSINTTGLSPGDYSASITASGSNVIESTTTISLTVLDSMPCARVAFETGGNINNSSTYGGGLFITNNSSGNVTITSVSIDLSTAVFPNVVFDPIGTAGDATAQCVTVISQTGGDANVGLTIPGNNGTGSDVDCVTPFSVPNGPGGYNVMTLNFNDFEAGETVDIAVDVDPKSIEGFNSAGNAGAISGAELIGSTVTVTYSDGSSATRQLYQVGSSVVNSENYFNPATVQCDAPSISLEGFIGNTMVNESAQIISINGPANANIEVLVYGTTIEDIGNNIPSDLFEMNKAQSLQKLTGLLNGSGQLQLDVDLTGLSNDQVYYVISSIIPDAVDCGPSACDISNVLRIKVENDIPVACPDDLVNGDTSIVLPGGTLVGGIDST